MGGHRLTVTESQLGVLVEALREALAADLLPPASTDGARQLLELLDAKLPSAMDHHPAGRVAGRLIAGDEILRLLLAREDRYGYAALGREDIAAELDWKPAGVSVRELLDELRRTGWLTARGQGAERLYGLTGKGRGRARELANAGTAGDAEARADSADELLDLIYADSGGANFYTSASAEPYGLWHRPTVQAAGRLDDERLARLERALRAEGLVGERHHSYGTITAAGARLARERWSAVHGSALYGPPRLARPYTRPREIARRHRDRVCPNCGHPASWLERRRSKRWDELRGRGEADYRCPSCDVKWTIYLEPTARDGSYDPLGDPAVRRPRWRYRGGWLQRDELAPPDHHPHLTGR
jgi:DNA-binding PadR family transcriptional regulator